jgi:hypothetical protein
MRVERYPLEIGSHLAAQQTSPVSRGLCRSETLPVEPVFCNLVVRVSPPMELLITVDEETGLTGTRVD